MWHRRDLPLEPAPDEGRLERPQSTVAASQLPWDPNPARRGGAEARGVARVRPPARRSPAVARSRTQERAARRVEPPRWASPGRPRRHLGPESRVLLVARADRPDHRWARSPVERRRARSPARVLIEVRCRTADQCRRPGRSLDCPYQRPVRAPVRSRPPANGRARPRCSRQGPRRKREEGAGQDGPGPCEQCANDAGVHRFDRLWRAERGRGQRLRPGRLVVTSLDEIRGKRSATPERVGLVLLHGLDLRVCVSSVDR